MRFWKVLSLLAVISSIAAAQLWRAPLATEAQAAPSTLSKSDVTVYTATWCSACRSLEKSLGERSIPFDTVDVEKNAQAWEKARSAAGAGNVIPLTGVVQSSGGTVWFVGADPDGVERAYRAR